MSTQEFDLASPGGILEVAHVIQQAPVRKFQGSKGYGGGCVALDSTRFHTQRASLKGMRMERVFGCYQGCLVMTLDFCDFKWQNEKELPLDDIDFAGLINMPLCEDKGTSTLETGPPANPPTRHVQIFSSGAMLQALIGIQDFKLLKDLERFRTLGEVLLKAYLLIMQLR